MGGSTDDPLVVLTVEDNPAEVRLLGEAFEEQDRPVTHVVATDGVEAFDVLYNREPHGETPRPDLVLLDIGLPTSDGVRVLADLRNLEAFETLPVVVYSGTDDPETIRECYRTGANAYVVKPGDYEEVAAVVERLLAFWADTATLPPTPVSPGLEG